MRLILDLQGAQTASRFRGIGRYALSLAQAIVRNRMHHDVVVVLNGMFPETIEPIRAAFDPLLSQDNIRVWLAPGPVRYLDPSNGPRREVAERLREAFIASLEPDLVHIGSLFEGFGDDAVTSIGVFAPQLPTAVTLFDLIPLTSPDPHPAFPDCYERKLQSLRRADLWLGISQFSCQEAIDRLQLDAGKVVNISCAAGPQFKHIEITETDRDRIMRTHGLNKPFIFWVGTAEPRKNLSGLMQAFALLEPELRAKFQILVLGKMQNAEIAALTRNATGFGLSRDDVVFAGYVSDDDLALLYNMCQVLVFPSLQEGFGLPALEAMQCGAPVIASNNSSLPEVIGLQEAMFDPHSPGAIASKLKRILLDDSFRKTLIAHNLRYAQRFSWDESAKRAIKAFEDCHSGRKNDLSPVTVYDKLIASVAQISRNAPDELSMLPAALAIARNHPEPGRERASFVDVSELYQRDVNTGVQRVTRSILKQFVDRPPKGYKVVPVYAIKDRYGYRRARLFMRDFPGAEQSELDEDAIIEPQPGDIFFGLDLQHHVVIQHTDFYEKIRNFGVRVYFLVYDLLPVIFPHYFPLWSSEDHHQWLSVLSQSDGVICISRTVADQYVDWLSATGVKRLRPLRIGWCHIGGDFANSAPAHGLPESAQQMLDAIARAPTFLMVGTIEPRKGYAQAIAASEQLWASGCDLQLVIVGKRGWMVERLIERLSRHPQLGKRLFWLEDSSDEYLQTLYGACSCLIAASEGEGFGLPLIEAARNRLPIIARDIPVFREVAGNHAHYFAGRSAEQLARSIADWLKLYAEDRHPKSDAMPWITWAQSAERMKAILFGGDWYALWPSDGRKRAPHHEDDGEGVDTACLIRRSE